MEGTLISGVEFCLKQIDSNQMSSKSKRIFDATYPGFLDPVEGNHGPCHTPGTGPPGKRSSVGLHGGPDGLV